MAISLTIPAAGAGVSSDVSTLAPTKTFVVNGSIDPSETIIIQSSGNPGGTDAARTWANVASFNTATPGRIVLANIGNRYRVFRVFAAGPAPATSPTVTIDAANAALSFLDLNIPTGVGVGVVSDITAFAAASFAVYVGGSFNNAETLILEGSLDNVSYDRIVSFNAGGVVSFDGKYNFVRVRRDVGTSTGLTMSIATSASSSSAAGVSTVVSNSPGVFANPVAGAVALNSSPNAPGDAANWLTRTAWFIDPSNVSGLASDSNTGATVGTPLLTPAEYCQRIRGARPVPGFPILVTLMSDMLAGQTFTLTDVLGTGAPGGAVVNPFSGNNWHMIVGVPTASYTGTFSAVHIPPAAVFNDRWTYTDATAPAFPGTVQMLKRTNGTVAYALRIKDEGAGVQRTSQWISGNAQATIAINDTYQILTLPIFRNGSMPQTFDQNQYMIALVNEVSTSVVNRPNSIRWVACTFTATSPVLNGAQMVNCGNLVNRFASTNPAGTTTEIRGGATIGNITLGASTWFNFGPNLILYHTIQAGAIIGGGYNKIMGGALAFNDNTTAMIQVDDSNMDYSIQNISGFGNTGRIVRITSVCNRVAVSSSQSNIMTTDATPWEVTGAAGSPSATPSLVNTAIFSAIANGAI